MESINPEAREPFKCSLELIVTSCDELIVLCISDSLYLCRFSCPDLFNIGAVELRKTIFSLQTGIDSLRVVDSELFLTSLIQRFLARDSIYAIARSLLSPVRPSVPLSVPLSVTRVDQSKTVQDRITQSSPQCSPMTLVSWRGTAP